MLYTDDDEASLKTPVVRPNDILSIEVSPVASASSWQFNSDCTETLQDTHLKQKVKGKKGTGDQNSAGSAKSQSRSPMKRGDPFLPSVFPDENPIADYSVKKNSRKKPSDCKCKGFGYNLSPSALLPEEMRQQWGVAMFGKPTISRSIVTPSPACCSTRDSEKKCVLQANLVKTNEMCASNNCCILRCKNCMRDPCMCSDLYAKYDGFRVPDTSVTRKQKSLTKLPIVKGKENKNIGSLVLGNANSVPVLKKVTFYNSKDNNNIISTSNFHRSNSSSGSINGHSSAVTEVNGYKNNCQSNGGGIRRNVNGSFTCSTRKLNYSNPDDFASRPRNRQLPMQHRRHLTNLSSPPILTAAGLRVPSSALETKSSVPRSASQMVVMANQTCACDSCRQRASFVSKMEELGYPTSHAQHMLPSFMLEASQGYQPATVRSATSTSGRYAPYNVPTYRYAHTTNSIYSSPERYECSSPSFYEYDDSPSMKSQPLTIIQQSVNHEASRLDSSYLDSKSSMASPQFLGFGEDITDLSIKDTVDFFVSMKSPFVKFTPSTSSDTSSVMCTSAMPCVEQSELQSYNGGLNSWYCSSGMCASPYTISPVQQETMYGDIAYPKFDVPNGQGQPVSLLYSSLVSDLEDELRCAIENIPTT